MIEIGEKITSSMARGVIKLNYEINIMKEHVLESNMAKNDVPYIARRVHTTICREPSHEKLVRELVFKPSLVKNDVQPTISGFKIFDDVKNLKIFEFPKPLYATIFVVQNPFWICGSHQNLILMK